MKKLAAILCLSALSTGAFAQGLINFFNNANALVSSQVTGQTATAIPATAGAFYFGLLTSTVGANNFTFANVLGTNQASLGRFTGGAGIQVAGWAAGTAKDFEVAGWSASLGSTFNPAWLTSNPGNGTTTFFGVSALGTGQSGGFNGTGTLPNLNIFGGTTGIQAGFALTGGGTVVPEPSSMALAGLGAAALLIFRPSPSGFVESQCETPLFAN
jgi:hypothetical protein